MPSCCCLGVQNSVSAVLRCLVLKYVYVLQNQDSCFHFIFSVHGRYMLLKEVLRHCLSFFRLRFSIHSITLTAGIPLMYLQYSLLICGPGSSVGIATDYGLDGPGSNPVRLRPRRRKVVWFEWREVKGSLKSESGW